MKFTKQETLKLFNSAVKPGVAEDDRAQLKAAWDLLVEQLIQDGNLAKEQVERWTAPY